MQKITIEVFTSRTGADIHERKPNERNGMEYFQKDR